MKRLLISTDCFLPRWDGVTRFLIELVPYLKEEYEITILAPEFEGTLNLPLEFNTIRIIRFPLIKIQFGDIYFTRFHYRRIKQIVKNIDLIFNQTLGPIGVCTISAAHRLNKPCIAFTHSIEWELTTRSIKYGKRLAKILTKKWARFFYNRCDLLLVPSIEVEEKFTWNDIHTPKHIVHLGTDTTKFCPPLDKATAKEAIGLQKQNIVIGFSGRVSREKNLVTLYRAFRKLEKTYPSLKLLIVGKGVHDVESIFSSSRNIHLAGSVDNVVPYLQSMDIFVLPSLTETTSLATMEAMACGVPVVTTPVGYVKEYVTERYNGLFFPFQNSTVLAMKIELLLQNPLLCEMLGKNARKTMAEKFSWKTTVEEIKSQLRF